MKLRTHYLLLTLTVALPVVLFSGLALKSLFDAQRGAQFKRIEELARSTIFAVDADIYRAKSVLQVLSDSRVLERKDFARFREKALAANAGSDSWIILYDAQGYQQVNTRLAQNDPLLRRPQPEELGEILRRREDRVSGVMWGPNLQKYFVLVEHPVHLPNGEQYVLAQAFAPEYFNKALAQLDIPASWRVGIIDRQGYIIARTVQADKLGGKKVKPETMAAIESGRTEILRHTLSDGLDVYDVFRRTPQTGWTVGVGAPVDEIDGAIWNSLYLSMFGLCGAFLMAGIAAGVTGRRLVRSIGSASRAALQIGQGQSVTTHDQSRITELEELHRALNSAAGLLTQERSSRLSAEAERNELFKREHEARAAAEQQNQAKDEFIAMLGHELRNPLAAITSAITVIDHGVPETRRQEVLDIIRRQSGHLRRMVDDLLDVSRVMSGKVTLHRRPLDLGKLARDCVETMQSTRRDSGHAITLSIAPSCRVDADATRMTQVINNLLDNALKFTPDGGVIEIGVASHGPQVALSVRDNGAGIEPEMHQRVFELFVQGEQSLQRETGGLGIGLSLVARLVQLHGGEVKLESEGRGKGTCLTVTLPCAEAAEVADAHSSAGAANAALPLRVLLVEDHDDGREMMSAMLEALDCDVVAAESGPRGIELALSTRPDVALVDIGLPGIDGYGVAQRLRQEPRLGGIRLIALTGYGAESDRIRAVQAGFDLHLTKPVGLDELQAALRP